MHAASTIRAPAAPCPAGGYWTLTGTGADEVLLGQDGKNQIDGGGGNEIAFPNIEQIVYTDTI